MTTFKGPLKIGDAVVGNSSLETSGYIACYKAVPLTSGTRTIVTFPANTVILSLKSIITSAIGGVDTAASAMYINCGTSADPSGYGQINVSGDGTGAGAQQTLTTVSGALLDTGGTMILTMSAKSTTTFTGGARAIIHYLQTE